jgi:hypothetical protein
MHNQTEAEESIRIGISACLLGQKVGCTIRVCGKTGLRESLPITGFEQFGDGGGQ